MKSISKKLIILLCCLSISGCWETSKGQKVGTIVKCASEGFFIKTYECELIRGGMNDGSGSFGKSFHFTASNAEHVKILNEALNNQKSVEITYHQEWISLWRTETKDNSFLDDIKFI